MGTEMQSPPPHRIRRVETTEILKRKWLSTNVFEIELSRPAAFEFEAGHTICFINRSIERHYSLVSAPHDTTLRLCVHHVPEGRFSPVLASAEIGARFRFTGPHGYFTFKPSRRDPVFVATGTGIAPFVSFARSGITDFTLFHESRIA